MRAPTWRGGRGFRRSNNRDGQISRHSACRAMQFLGQFTKTPQGAPSPGWPSNARAKERWTPRRSLLKCSDRNQDRDVRLIFLEVSLDAHVRIVPVINRRIPGLFLAVGYLPFNRCSSRFILRKNSRLTFGEPLSNDDTSVLFTR